MAEQDLDRNEAATPYKLSEARKRGQVAKSPDVIAAVVFAAAIAYLYARGWDTLRDQFRFDRLLFAQAANLDGSGAALWRLVEHSVKATFSLLMPLLATVVVAAIVGNVAQTGPVFSFHPLSPDWTRVNPATGFKRLFSARTVFDALRACVKLVVLVLVVYLAIKSLVPHLRQLAGMTPLAHLHTLVDDVASLGVKLALALAVIAALDFAYTRREFDKKMRMSRREMRDEHKNREGDPRIRARLRELRREMLKRSLSLRKTRDADLLITNPTHIAVALRYRHGEMDAPQLVGKGAGAMAAAMRQIAARHRIPVVQNRTLARALYKQVELEHPVPQEFYGAVARLMVWVLAMRESRRAAGAAA